MTRNACNDNTGVRTLDILTGRMTDDVRNFPFHAICSGNPETALARLRELREHLNGAFDDAEADIRNSAA